MNINRKNQKENLRNDKNILYYYLINHKISKY